MKTDFFLRLADLLEDLLNRSLNIDNELTEEALDTVFATVIYELYNTINLDHLPMLRRQIIENALLGASLDHDLCTDITRARTLFTTVIKRLLIELINDRTEVNHEIENVIDSFINEFALSYETSKSSYDTIPAFHWSELNSRNSSSNFTTYVGYKLLQYCFGDSSSLEIVNIFWDQLMLEKALMKDESPVYSSAKEVYGQFDQDVASFVEALLGENSVNLLNRYAQMIFDVDGIDEVRVDQNSLAMLDASKYDENRYVISSRSLKTLLVILPAFMSTLKKNYEQESLKPVINELQTEKEMLQKSTIKETSKMRSQLDELNTLLFREKQKNRKLKNRNTDLETYKDSGSSLMNKLDTLESEMNKLKNELFFKEEMIKLISDELVEFQTAKSELNKEFVFPEPVYVNYFGPEKDLHKVLLRYNIIVELYSPFDPPINSLKRSDINILNTQRASHAVYYWLKSNVDNLILVNNSNPYLIKSAIRKYKGLC